MLYERKLTPIWENGKGTRVIFHNPAYPRNTCVCDNTNITHSMFVHENCISNLTCIVTAALFHHVIMYQTFPQFKAIERLQ